MKIQFIDLSLMILSERLLCFYDELHTFCPLMGSLKLLNNTPVYYDNYSYRNSSYRLGLPKMPMASMFLA